MQANDCRISGLNFDENADYRRKKDDTPTGLHLSTSGHEADGVVSRLSTLLPFEAQTILMAAFPDEHALRHIFKSTVHLSGIVLKTVIIVMHLSITSTCLQASL